jgi:hypothetical protein
MRHSSSSLGLLAVMVCAGTLSTPELATGQDRLSLTPSEAFLRQPGRTLVFDHLTGAWELLSADGRPVHGDEGGVTTELVMGIAPGDAAEVVIKNANTLLYDYEVGLTALSGAPELRRCGDLGKVFLGQSALVVAAGRIASPGDPTGWDSLEDPWYSAVDATSFSFGAGGRSVARNLNDEFLRRDAETSVAELENFVLDLRSTVRTASSQLRILAHRADVEAIEGLAQDFRSSLGDLSDPANLVEGLETRLSRAFDFVDEVERRQLIEDPVEGPSIRERADSAATEVLLLGAELRETLTTLRRAELQSTIRYAFRGPRRAARVDVKLTDGGRLRGAQASVGEGLRTGDGSAVFVQPATAIQCQISLGFLWATPSPEYSLGPESRIQNLASRSEFRTSAAMFIHASATQIPLLAITAGLGLGLGTGAPDFFLGLTIRELSPLMVTAGTVWQREDALPEGFGTGSPATALDLAQLDRIYRRRLFLGVGFTR